MKLVNGKIAQQQRELDRLLEAPPQMFHRGKARQRACKYGCRC